jgi:hypothetical protein
LYSVGTFFQHTSGDLYLLVNTGRCPMLVGVSSGNRWADDYNHYAFQESFYVRSEYEWSLVTSGQPGAFTKVDVRIDGLTITPSWEV